MEEAHHQFAATEEEAVTPGGLTGISVFVGVGFVLMAFLGEEEFRRDTLILGGVFLAVAVLMVFHLMRQRRYGTATLRAIRPFEDGKPFQGHIDTEVRALPTGPVRIRIYGKFFRSQRTMTRARVPSDHLRLTGDGTVRIPFLIVLPDDSMKRGASEVRLRVRTASWPLGWGGTFILKSL